MSEPLQNARKYECEKEKEIASKESLAFHLYTGVQRVRNSNGSADEYQTQCVAIGNGADYEKYIGNPVSDAHSLLEGRSISDFCEPKIWQDSDDIYWLIADILIFVE